MDIGSCITVPSHLLHPRGGDHYILRVVGNSMDEEGIFDGDYVIVLRRETAENREMIIALVEDDLTIKRYYKEEGGIVRLQPSSRRLAPIVLPSSDVVIRGVVVGIMRKC